VKHVYWLLEGLLAGRPGPVQAPWDLDELRTGGLRAIVSLNTEQKTAEVTAAGLRHHSLPMPPLLPLSEALQDMLLRQLEEVLAAIHAEVSAGQPTLVHCHAGKDRTGLALTAYLVRHHGLEVEEAIARVRGVQPVAMSAPGYLATARRFPQHEEEKKESGAQSTLRKR
jgi:protein-tyrosine phosphatase